MDSYQHDSREWLEADGLGGFASGTVNGIRTRRYHGLLLTATTPPTGRMMLVNGLEVWVDTPAGRLALSSSRYAPDVVHPDGASRIVRFTADPWPTWHFALDDGTEIVQEVLIARRERATLLRWTRLKGHSPLTLVVRPFFSGRDYHSMCHENPSFAFEPLSQGVEQRWAPYPGVPTIRAVTNGDYRHAPDWYRHFLYADERARGLDDTEDLASPGEWHMPLTDAPAHLALSSEESTMFPDDRTALVSTLDSWREHERSRRASLGDALGRAADAYLVRRGNGVTVVAGYPWFTDWGRDTFIALRGLCLATDRLADARDILLEWSGTVSEGMLPNRFPDGGDPPEYNSVDASLWYIVAVHELQELSVRSRTLSDDDRRRLDGAVDAILEGYARGTRFGIRCDADGLLRAGVPGVQLTWMDAKVGDWVVTPRIGKPVEVNALWINALAIGARRHEVWREAHARAVASFATKFWNEAEQCLFDVIDVDGVVGRTDASIRPNQILAVGGLPFPCLDGERARHVVARVELDLVTPLGLRSLAPGSQGYAPRYEGGVLARDGAYHQGTVWPWLMGPFVDAWLRVYGCTATARATARRAFVQPLVDHLEAAGIGHVSEITDAESPFTPRGCPFQAWSLASLLYLSRVLLPTTAERSPGAAESGASDVQTMCAAGSR